MNYNCPVCDTAFANDWRDSFDICPTCNIQFGYDDVAGGSEERQQALYAEWRRVWQENGRQALTKDQQLAVHAAVGV